MSLPSPPAIQPVGSPVIETLTAGTLLRRVHGGHPADSFNWTVQPTVLAGGRFDSLDGAYGYTYLGESDAAAIAETLCRDLPLGGPARLVPRSRLTGRRITTVEVARDLAVLVLHGAALTHVGAPLALTKCDADEYLVTREWAAGLRGWLPDVAGFVYRCRHDEDLRAWVLFDDGPPSRRAHAALRAQASSTALDSADGIVLVKQVLRQHNAALS